MKRSPLSTLLATLLAFTATLGAQFAQAQTAYAIDTSNNLVKFSVQAPGSLMSVVPITGMVGGDTVVGIDFRPATGQLFALGSGSRLYVINVATGAATQVGASGAFTLSGTVFGMDFNPTVDRIRVVSDSDQNLRLNPDTGALAAADTALAFATGDANASANPNIAGSAYISNVAGATTTTLFNIDSNLDVLVNQNPPNNGTLNTVGSLGVNASAVMGFDVLTVGAVNTAYATLEVNGLTRLYTVNLNTGAATAVGTVGAGGALRGLAVNSDVNYSGAWFNAGESGWGLSILRGESGSYGIVMYHYNQPRNPTWYFMSGGTLAGSTYTAPVLQFTGSYFGEPFNTIPAAGTNVGTATITFTSDTTATLMYTISGVTVTKAISKLTF